MSRAFGIAAVGLAAAAAAVWWGWPKPTAAPPAATKAPAPAVPAQQPPVAPAVAPVAPPAAPPAAAPVVGVGFPDGSTAPPLNGVKERVQLVWNDRPFSPIKTKITSGGVEWYLHEDGSHSTVQYIEINGKPQPVGLVCSPTDVLPTHADLQQQLKQQGQQPGR